MQRAHADAHAHDGQRVVDRVQQPELLRQGVKAEHRVVHKAPHDGGNAAVGQQVEQLRVLELDVLDLHEHRDEQRHDQAVARIRQHHAEEAGIEGRHHGRGVDAAVIRQRIALHHRLEGRGKLVVVQLHRRLLLIQRVAQLHRRDGRELADLLFDLFGAFGGDPTLRQEGALGHGKAPGGLLAALLLVEDFVEDFQPLDVPGKARKVFLHLIALGICLRNPFLEFLNVFRGRTVAQSGEAFL